MEGRVRRRPSAAMIIAVLALTGALAGTAVAGPDAFTSALTKKKVKKIATNKANKAIEAAEPEYTVGRSDQGSCNADSGDRTICVSTTVDLPRSGRVLLVHGGEWFLSSFGPAPIAGNCDITEAAGTSPTASASADVDDTDIFPGETTGTGTSGRHTGQGITTVTGVLGAGTHTFAVVCEELDSDLDWRAMTLSAVMIGSG
jgi:hypothetical protein